TATARIISLSGAEFGLEALEVERPVVHLIVNPDGTNVPGPRPNGSENENPIQQLFALSIGKLQVRSGELIYGDKRLPLDFIAHDVNADMRYGLFRRRFHTHISVGKGDTSLADYRPFSWSGEAQFALSREAVEIQQLRLTSTGSTFEAKGNLEDFSRPRVTLD